GFGQVLTATDPLGSVTLFAYDSRGNPISTTRDFGPGRLNQLTIMAYSAAGDVIAVTDPNGNVTASSYDAARQLKTVTSPPTAAPPSGWLTIWTSEPDGHVPPTQQSAAGVVLRTTAASYTLTGKPATATDANGNVTRYAYDTVDRLAGITDAEGRVTGYAY